MRLHTIAESEERFAARVRRAYRGEGKTENRGLSGVADEFGCDLNTAKKYVKVLNLGTYGEHDIDDRVLHRVRAPQNLYKLLLYFDIPKNAANEIMRFHINNKAVIDTHRATGGTDDEEAMRQLFAGERIAAMIRGPKEKLEKDGYIASLVPWYDKEFFKSMPEGVFYVYHQDDTDLVRLLLDAKLGDDDNERRMQTRRSDLLHGLLFGYPMELVFNYVRERDRELVDSICGNVDKLGR